LIHFYKRYIFEYFFTMNSSPKYFSSTDVKELARSYGWTELPVHHSSDETSVLNFYSEGHGGVRASVSVITGCVSTSLDHPTKKKTQLFRGERVTCEELEQVFENPRLDITGSTYKTRSKLREIDNSDVSDVGCDIYEGLDDIELLLSEDSVSSIAADDVAVDLYARGRFEEDFESLSLIDRLLEEWNDESEEVDALVKADMSEFSDVDDMYHKSVSETDFNSESSSSEEDSDSETDDNSTTDIVKLDQFIYDRLEYSPDYSLTCSDLSNSQESSEEEEETAESSVSGSSDGTEYECF